jgi:hypothetical protein
MQYITDIVRGSPQRASAESRICHILVSYYCSGYRHLLFISKKPPYYLDNSSSALMTVFASSSDTVPIFRSTFFFTIYHISSHTKIFLYIYVITNEYIMANKKNRDLTFSPAPQPKRNKHDIKDNDEGDDRAFTLQDFITEAFNKLSISRLIDIKTTNREEGQVVRQRISSLLGEKLFALDYVRSLYTTSPSLFQDIQLKVKSKMYMYDRAFMKGHLAKHITHLVVDDETKDLIVLPKQLTQLVFLKWRTGLISSLSEMDKLRYLVTPSPWTFQQLPKSLTHLSICPSLTEVLEYIRVPTGITHLEIRGEGIAFLIDRCVNVTHLSLLHCPFRPRQIPDSVTHLRLGDSIVNWRSLENKDLRETKITHLAIYEHQLVNITLFPSGLSHLDILFQLQGNILGAQNLVTRINSRLNPDFRDNIIIRYVLTDIVKVEGTDPDEEEDLLIVLSALLPNYVLASSDLDSWYNWPQLDGNNIDSYGLSSDS